MTEIPNWQSYIGPVTLLSTLENAWQSDFYREFVKGGNWRSGHRSVPWLGCGRGPDSGQGPGPLSPSVGVGSDGEAVFIPLGIILNLFTGIIMGR